MTVHVMHEGIHRCGAHVFRFHIADLWVPLEYPSGGVKVITGIVAIKTKESVTGEPVIFKVSLSQGYTEMEFRLKLYSREIDLDPRYMLAQIDETKSFTLYGVRDEFETKSLTVREAEETYETHQLIFRSLPEGHAALLEHMFYVMAPDDVWQVLCVE